jgi:hypothetical protein
VVREPIRRAGVVDQVYVRIFVNTVVESVVASVGLYETAHLIFYQIVRRRSEISWIGQHYNSRFASVCLKQVNNIGEPDSTRGPAGIVVLRVVCGESTWIEITLLPDMMGTE